MALVDQKHNTEMSRNSYPIIMFQGGPLHKPYFITIDNWRQVIIGPNKKTVAIYVVEELEVFIWFMRTWMLKQGYCYNWCLLVIAWIMVKSNDDMIGYTTIISVSTSYNRCNNLAWSLYSMTHLLHGIHIVSSWLICIYSVDTILYSYTLPIDSYPISFSSLCLSCNLSQA